MRRFLILFMLIATTSARVEMALAEYVPIPAAARELVVWGAWRRRGLDAAFRRFEVEHPGWRVVVSTAAGAGQMDPQKLMCGIAGGSPPDMLIQDRFSIGEWALRGAFMPLDEFVRKSVEQEKLATEALDAIAKKDPHAAGVPLRQLIVEFEKRGPCRQLDVARRALQNPSEETADELAALCKGINRGEFYDACWEEACFGQGDARRVYAIPNTTDVRALFYNIDLLERAGLVDENGVARPPRDWDELREYALKLTEHDARGNLVRLGFAPLFGNSWLYLYGYLNGGEFLSADGRTCTLDEPRIVEALRYMVNLYDSLGGIERVSSFQSTFQANELDPFLTGKVAMKIDGEYFQNAVAIYAPGLRFGMAPAPPPEGKKALTWSGGFSWAVPVGSKNPEMAFELIRFLNTDRTWMLRAEVESRYAASRGRPFIPEMAPLPHVNQMVFDRFVRDNPELPQRFKHHLLFAADLMKISRYRPVTPVGQLLWDEHVRATEKAIRHSKPPQQALADGTRAVQTQLDRIWAADATRGPKVNWWYPFAVAVVALACAVPVVRKLAGPKRVIHRGGSEARAGYLFASPWLVGFIALTAGPIVVSIVYSMCRYDVLHAPEYVGFENYRELISDPLFWRSLANTAFMLLGIPLGMTAGLGIALLLNREVRGMRVYRTIFYLPAVVPLVASSLLWLWVLNPEVGLLNSMLRMIGVSNPPRWLASPSWVLGSKTGIILMGLWGAGSSMIIWLAGLKGVPQQLYEAASIDGAGTVRRFFHVTLPMLSPYIFFNLVTGIIGTMQVFDQAYIMTQGGPDDSTMFHAYYLFNNAFRYFKMGYASAMAWILFLIVLALTLIQLAAGRKWVHYDQV